MEFEALELRDFRRYEYLHLAIEPPGLAWIGPNASGKTSLLEAIQKIALLRGFGREEEMVRWGAASYRLRARLKEGLVEVYYERQKGTRLLWEGSPIQPLAQWIGRLPVVTLRPADIHWIEGGGTERRRWADRLLSQLSPTYLEALSLYQRALAQRNALLNTPSPTPLQLEPWEEQLITHGILLQQARLALTEQLNEALRDFYTFFGPERPRLTYRLLAPPSPQAWRRSWETLRPKELQRRHTLLGPQQEDFILYLEEKPARGYASEGQKKSLLLALKWAEVALFCQRGKTPILLLDDIGEKLDAHRLQAVAQLSRLALQTFLTDVEEQRIARAFPDLPRQRMEGLA
ncbi:MAG: DNA replication and repair protein RecF [Bacteroidia bacterium]